MMNENNNENLEMNNANAEPLQNPVVQPEPTPKKEKPKKGNKTLLIILVIIIVLGVVAALVVPSMLDKKEEPKQEQKKEEPKQTVDYSKDFQGSYTLNGAKIDIYPISGGRIFYSLVLANNSGLFQGFMQTDANKVAKDNNIELTLKDNAIELKSLNADYENIVSGTYAKTGDYTAEDVYKEMFGYPQYLTSKYNGLYKNGTVELYMYQTEANKVEVEIVSKSASSMIGWSSSFIIQTDGTLKQELLFDDDVASNLTINGDNIIFEYRSNDQSDVDSHSKLNGTYVKEKTLTVEDILNNL